MEEYKNEFLDGLVGRSVLVRQLTGPALDEEFVATLDEDPTSVLTQPLHSRTAVFALESYDRVGVVLRPITEEPFSLFVPWSAIIELSRAGSEERWTRA